MQLSMIFNRSVLTDAIFRIRSSCAIVLYSNRSDMVGFVIMMDLGADFQYLEVMS